MRIHFKTKKLKALYDEDRGANKYPKGVVDAFFEVLATVRSAVDERELYNLKSLHFERLGGKRGRLEHRSIRLNDQYRLVLIIERDQDGKYLLITSLEKHYR